MHYITYYESPLGKILLAADALGLTGLWFVGQKYYAQNLAPECLEQEVPVLVQAKHWLEIYFAGQVPNFSLPLHLQGTPFQLEVWKLLQTIPYGTTITYGDLAQQLAVNRGVDHMSAQAVGGAVGRNPIAIIVPCHRVVGANGSLTGYAGGVERKHKLLELEQKYFLL